VTIRQFILSYAKRHPGFALYQMISDDDFPFEFKLKDIVAELEKMSTLKDPLLIRVMDRSMPKIVFRYYLPKSAPKEEPELDKPTKIAPADPPREKPTPGLERWC